MHLRGLSLLYPLTSWCSFREALPAKVVETLVTRLLPWLASGYAYQNQIYGLLKYLWIRWPVHDAPCSAHDSVSYLANDNAVSNIK